MTINILPVVWATLIWENKVWKDQWSKSSNWVLLKTLRSIWMLLFSTDIVFFPITQLIYVQFYSCLLTQLHHQLAVAFFIKPEVFPAHISIRKEQWSEFWWYWGSWSYVLTNHLEGCNDDHSKTLSFLWFYSVLKRWFRFQHVFSRVHKMFYSSSAIWHSARLSEYLWL